METSSTFAWAKQLILERFFDLRLNICDDKQSFWENRQQHGHPAKTS